MTTENNCVIDISERLKSERKERQKDDGVMFSQGFDMGRSSDGVPTHIEVYAGCGTDAIGINLTIGDTSTLVMLMAKEADEFGRALLS